MPAIAPPAPAALMTAEEFWAWWSRPENLDGCYELDEGRVVEVPSSGPLHGLICPWVGHRLCSYVVRHGQGYALSHDTAILLARNPDTVRGPDLMLFLDARTLADMSDSFVVEIPSLVIEVYSTDFRPVGLARRVQQFLARGVPLVWVIDPDRLTVEVYRQNLPRVELTAADTLGGFDALPGFACRVADLFTLPGRPPAAAPTEGS